jgi:hypothetical protein
MQQKLVYVELKTGFSDNGPAWIGKAFSSKTGKSTYFNGQIFSKGDRHSGGNHIELSTGDSYWISGLKRNGEDRHWAGGGKINIDKDSVPEYLVLIKSKILPAGKFEVVELDNEPKIDKFRERQNQKLNPSD